MTKKESKYETVEVMRFHSDMSIIFAPPKLPWVELTAMDIHNTQGYKETREMYRFALAIEAKSKEKNGVSFN